MESQEMMEGDRAADGSVNGLDGDEWEQVGFGENVSENLGDELLVNLESYLDDINDRLMILRMVSDSVIKGMLNAVEQEAAEKIAAKELEVANLKESLKFHNAVFDEIECFGLHLMEKVPESKRSGRSMTFKEACLEHVNMRESLKSLKNVGTEQFEKLKKGIDNTRGSGSIKRISSGSELVALGGILQENESESWVNVDRMLDSLKMTLDNICSQADAMLRSSKYSLCELHWERNMQEELEAMVIHCSIQTIQEEFEQILWSQSAQLTDRQSIHWVEKFNRISDVRKELDAILKSLSQPESGQLTSLGYHEVDHLLRKTLSNHIISSASHWDGNGKLEATRTDIPENFDAAQLKHLSKEELVAHFNTMITKMRRDHESTVHELTEECFSLKREYLKERGSSLTHKKDKEFDVLRKKIPEVILRLDDILVENEKLPLSSSNAESFRSLKDRLDIILSENHQLRDSLRDKKNEVKFLSSQVADAAEKVLQHSILEANMLKMIGNLNSDLEDARIEAALSEDVCKCILSEIMGHMKCDTEESDLKFIMMQQVYDIVLNGVVKNAEIPPTSEIEDSDIESLILQGIYELLFRETLKDTGEELNKLYGQYLVENQNQTSVEMKLVEKENQLKSEAEHKERLKQEIVILAQSLEEKEKFAMDMSTRLTIEREQFEVATQELDNLREDANQQQILVSQTKEELELVRGQLAEALTHIEVDKVEIQKLNTNLEEAYRDLEDANEQRKMALALIQEKHASFLLMESKEKELRNQVEAVMVDVHGLSKMLGDFECKVTGKIRANSLRFEDSFSQLNSLLKKVKLLKRTGRKYQQRFEKRCADLQMAEAEVDLLGDEVDKLLNLLEKIYVALDHYSPVLQHYPGVMETLKLIRRELSGGSLKPPQFSP
ncbi:hypothetical protein ACH5RR_015694 [Cinchona calisaya]|uniref:WPP domain-associated protein n=1 Tax=Cinchona calisaya TaxID=153742 RepID=A0ABD2ZTT6_9GENT